MRLVRPAGSTHNIVPCRERIEKAWIGQAASPGGSKPPSPPASESGERCKLPQLPAGSGAASGAEPQKILIFCISDPQNVHSNP